MIDLNRHQGLSNSYKNARPFPNVVVDDFVDDTLRLEESIYEMENFPYWGTDQSHFSLMEDRQINKWFVPWCDQSLDDLAALAPITLSNLQYFNSAEFLNFLEQTTGIEGLIPDPAFTGGGIHKIIQGGRLGIHADYLLHPTTGLHRRLNLLIYLNKTWSDDWGGNLEFWDEDMISCQRSVEPIFNRAVLFNITSKSFHGHPGLLKCPEGVSRFSYALYYFTLDRPEEEKENMETHAVWKKPQSETLNAIFKI